jgi:hypothetical protein
VICNSSNDVVDITLQNTGTSTIEAGTIALTVTDQQDRVLKVVANESVFGNNFDQNQILPLGVPLNDDVLTQNNTYGVKITLPGGIEGTSDCIAQE